MLIVLEGLDGAGKSTQVELVRRMFAQEGVESHFLHFPRFDAPVYGELIARFLRGISCLEILRRRCCTGT